MNPVQETLITPAVCPVLSGGGFTGSGHLGQVAIYALIDPRDGAVRYVGKSKNPEKRRNAHCHRQCSAGLKRWIDELNTFGLKPSFEVLELCGAKDWPERERFWISEQRKLTVELLNVCNGGNGTDEVLEATIAKARASNTGKKRSPECIARMRGRKMSDKHRAALRASNLGFKQSVETLAKLSMIRRGKRPSAETRAKLSASRTGKKRTAQARANMSAAQRGRTISEEHRFKLRSANLGKKQNPEVVARRNAKNRGRKCSEQGLANMRAAWIKRKNKQ